MTDQTTKQDLEERIDQIESMLLEGRSSVQHGGWGLVIFGVAYLIASGLSWLTNRPTLVWATTMITAACLCGMIGRARAKGVRSIGGRTVGAIWGSIGGALWIFCFVVPMTGHFEVHSFVAAIYALVGAGNLATGILLRWLPQTLLGILWWAAAIAACLVPGPQRVGWIFLAMTVAMIGFGIYLMILESRASRAMKQVAHV